VWAAVVILHTSDRACILEMAWHRCYTEVACHSIAEAHTTYSRDTWMPFAVDDRYEDLDDDVRQALTNVTGV